jgi:membrane associated rhomboid family serine protease
MLEDRSYMRAPRYEGKLSATVWLMIGITGAFMLQEIIRVYGNNRVLGYLALSGSGLAKGYLWQLVSFQFLHGGLFHLLCNLIGLWFFGRFVEDRLGAGRMLRLFFFCGVLGGLTQVLVGLLAPKVFAPVILGASAGVLGLLATFALLEPEGVILLFFVLPVRAKYILWASVGLALFFTIVPSDRGVAHAAHLGGLLGGIAYVRWGLAYERVVQGWFSRRQMRPARPRWEMARTTAAKRSFWQRSKAAGEVEDLPAAEFISREVDPILDKISAHGIQSLTERERRILEAARQKMSKR